MPGPAPFIASSRPRTEEVNRAYPLARGGVPLTGTVRAEMNAFATTGAVATLLLMLAAVTLPWGGGALSGTECAALSGFALASALGLFAYGRASLLAAYEAAYLNAGVPPHEALRRARVALHESLSRRAG